MRGKSPITLGAEIRGTAAFPRAKGEIIPVAVRSASQLGSVCGRLTNEGIPVQPYQRASRATFCRRFWKY